MSATKYKLLAIDVDGTLIGPEGDVADPIVRAVDDAEWQGWMEDAK